MSLLSTFIVNSELSVVCFRRDNCKNGPFFAVREFDIKVIRSRDKGRRGRGPSEQAIRASIRQAVLNMNLKSERASKAEIRQLKGHGILGKRAPSCSLLCAEDMCRLLEAFGKDACVRDLRSALLKDDSEKKLKINNEKGSSFVTKRKALSLSPRPIKVEKSETEISLKRPKLAVDTSRSKNSFLYPLSLPNKSYQQPSFGDTNGLDALYSALLAFSGNTDPMTMRSFNITTIPYSTQEVENNLGDGLPSPSSYSLPSPISISPTTSPTTSPSLWSSSPQSPSSPLSDSSFIQRFPLDTSTSSSEEDQSPKISISPSSSSSSSSFPSNLSFAHPTVLRPRKKKKIIKTNQNLTHQEISSLIVP